MSEAVIKHRKEIADAWRDALRRIIKAIDKEHADK